MRASASILSWVFASVVCRCHPAPRVASLPVTSITAVSARDAAVAATDASLVVAPTAALTPGASLRLGCFAWSARLSSAACVVESPTDDLVNLRVVVRFTGDASGVVAPIVDDAAFEESRAFVASRERAVAVNGRLARDGYASIVALQRDLSSESDDLWEPDTRVQWERRTVSEGGDNHAARFTDRVTVRWDVRAQPMVVTLLDERPVESPRVSTYAMSDGRTMLLELVGRFADEGEYGTHARAWRCDRSTRACVAQ